MNLFFCQDSPEWIKYYIDYILLLYYYISNIIFDSCGMKSLWFRFGHDIFTCFKMASPESWDARFSATNVLQGPFVCFYWFQQKLKHFKNQWNFLHCVLVFSVHGIKPTTSQLKYTIDRLPGNVTYIKSYDKAKWR